MLDQFPAPEITFLGEQDGPAERRLKEALGVLLGLDPTVTRAYLARVLYDGKTGGVMLALLTDDDKDNEKLVEQVGKTFAALLNTTAHLDIVFLDEARDAEIRKTCPPFYNRYAAWQA
ncbi:MAG TPA: enhanced serine sensitivity protein SseB C-terminal domain-containing protein [Bradyrhizobium sp.]|nr:enhanced serine sensitivity protein SseB C-terminal domain-containing protein [Bradyrhizobium sp.]